MTGKRRLAEHDNDGEATKHEKTREAKRLRKELRQQRREVKERDKQRRAEEKATKKKNERHINGSVAASHKANCDQEMVENLQESLSSAILLTGDNERNTYDKESSELFYSKRVEFSISVLPMSLDNVKRKIEDGLADNLLRYVDSMGGVLLAFNNVQTVVKHEGDVLNDSPHMHYKVMTDTLLFCPDVGSNLTGVINQTFHTHLSVTVLSNFHACIHGKYLRAAGYDFDIAKEQWYKLIEDTRRVISCNDEIKFVCEKLHECGGILSMEGSNPVIIHNREVYDNF